MSCMLLLLSSNLLVVELVVMLNLVDVDRSNWLHAGGNANSRNRVLQQIAAQ